MRRVGISRGRMQQGNEGEGRNSSELFQKPLKQCGEPCTMHGCSVVMETPHDTTKDSNDHGKEKKRQIYPQVSQSPNYIILNRARCPSISTESCLERVCCIASRLHVRC